MNDSAGSQNMTFKKQVDACAWLELQGYKVKKTTFNTHLKQGFIPRNADGTFSASALLGYAAARLTPTVRIDDEKAKEATLAKLNSDADLKAVRAARERLRLAKEQGKLMPVAEYEQALAARALFFRSEIEGFIRRTGQELIGVVTGDADRLPELMEWWEEKTADWMDAWSQEREFLEAEDDDEEVGEA